MSGIEEHNHPAFERATRVLRDRGFDVVSPHEESAHPIGSSLWQRYMRADIKTLADRCDGIMLLRGWGKSTGSKIELFIAVSLGYSVAYFDDVDERVVWMER
jgi:hypothetical protein